ncbi:MAG: ATP-binding protein [Thermodesulfobacteriota bacterium]
MVKEAFRRWLGGGFGLRVFAAVSLALVVSTAMGVGLYVAVQEQSREETLHREASLLVKLLADNLRLPVFAGNQEAVAASLGGVFRHGAVLGVCVTDAQGGVLVRLVAPTADAGLTSVLEQGLPPELLGRLSATAEPLMTAGEGFHKYWAPIVARTVDPSGTTLYFSEEIDGEPYRLLGVVGMAVSTEALVKAGRQALAGAVAVAVAFLLASLSVTYLTVRLATRPLAELVHRVRPGVASEAGDELSVLGLGFTGLLSDLSEAFRTIEVLKADLEKRVEARTAELAVANQELAARQQHLEEANHQLAAVIEEMRSTQMQLVQAEKMAALGQLVAGMAHEINNTANIIAGALPPLEDHLLQVLDLMAQALAIEPKQRVADLRPALGSLRRAAAEADYPQLRDDMLLLMRNIQEGTRRTVKIVQDLRDFARRDPGQPTRVDLNAGLETTLALLYSQYKHRIELALDLQPDLPRIEGYPTQLNQVFMNILLNAIQAMPDKGQIRVRTWADVEGVHVTVQDTGPGILPEALPKVFDPFFTTKPVGQGTGLGLSVSYGIVRRHNGRITAESTPGQGALFHVQLPVK